MPRIMVPYPRACWVLCIASCFYCHIFLLMLCISVWNSFYPHTSLVTLRECLAGFHEDNRKSTSNGCFFCNFKPLYEDRFVSLYYNFVNDADKRLHEGFTEYTKFTAIVDLYNVKCMAGWTNNSFTWLLEKLNKMLPSDASLPKDAYEAKKCMSELGLGYAKISVCVNSCMLFWKENENVENCKVCGKSKKVLRWFPLKSRLQSLFLSPKIASHMKWHAENCTNDGVLRYPMNALAWKTFDSQYLDFAYNLHEK